LDSKGIEAELEAAPFKGFELGYNFGYTNAVYKSLKISESGNEVDLEGKKQIFTPDITSMLAAQYSFTLAEKQQLRLMVRGEWSYIGNTYFDLENNIQQKPYSVLNARAGVALKHVSVFFWGRNLGSTKYIAYAYDFGAVHLGDPKTYGITLRADL
jgi:iron complex outermembrane receptor protein